jgi:lysophospholipase L1-like esterase
MSSLLLVLVAFVQQPTDPFAKWEQEVAAIEKRLKETPPPKGGVVFAGSSSIRLWDLKTSFPELNAVNVGFGGSQIPDSTHFAPRLILPHEPKAVVFYAGDNDLAAKRTPAQVRDDFAGFAKAVHEKLPKTKIHFIPVKPSLKRWELFDKQKWANALVKEFCAKDSRLGYIDIVPAMLGPDGKPIEDLFVKDGLHLSPQGYELWTKAVTKALAD